MIKSANPPPKKFQISPVPKLLLDGDQESKSFVARPHNTRTMSSTLFDDIFKITSVESNRYDRVSRITAQSTTSTDINLTLDINSELFPIQKGNTITLAIAQTLSIDGEETSATTISGWREPRPGDRSLADDYDYVMYGTVYKFDEAAGDKM